MGLRDCVVIETTVQGLEEIQQLEGFLEQARQHIDGQKSFLASVDIYAEKEIWYGSKLQLREFTLKDGTIYREIIQEERWDSGPNTCTTLCRNADHVTSLDWTYQEIRQAMGYYEDPEEVDDSDHEPQ